MMTNRLNEDKFDRMLTQALQRHSEPVPADFDERMMTAIEQAEQQRILAAVVMQQRLALAASIVLGVAAIVTVIFFPSAVAGVLRSIAGGLMEQGSILADRLPKAVETVGSQWQFYATLAAVFGFAVYSLADLLLGDRLRRIN
jgi:hypothetical protein